MGDPARNLSPGDHSLSFFHLGQIVKHHNNAHVMAGIIFKGIDMNQKEDGFFNKLLVTEGKPPGCGSCSNSIERSSRPSRRKKSPIHVARPTFNTFFKEKKVVTESKFRRGSASPIERGTRYLPPGTLQGESYFEHRSKFENGSQPVVHWRRH